MPKEIVYAQHSPWGDEHPAVTVVQVLWGRDEGHVQIVTRAIDRSTHGDVEPPGVERKEGDLLFTDGMYVDLERRAINDLIRHLRRARDQAFGRDE